MGNSSYGKGHYEGKIEGIIEGILISVSLAISTYVGPKLGSWIIKKFALKPSNDNKTYKEWVIKEYKNKKIAIKNDCIIECNKDENIYEKIDVFSCERRQYE